MFFTIVSGDGMDVFDIFTDKVTQEGVLTVSKVRSRGSYSVIGPKAVLEKPTSGDFLPHEEKHCAQYRLVVRKTTSFLGGTFHVFSGFYVILSQIGFIVFM